MVRPDDWQASYYHCVQERLWLLSKWSWRRSGPGEPSDKLFPRFSDA
jgi:hypothetical protein